MPAVPAPTGDVIHHESMIEDFYLAIPLQNGQLSCREVMNGEKLSAPLAQDQAVMIDVSDSPYARVDSLKQEIYKRGL